MIPISVVRLSPQAEELAVDVIRSGTIAQGPKVAEFERRFAELVGAEHAVAVNNGTTSLVASLQVLDLQPGDEVVTSPFTFVATLNAILEAGATARFGDISTDDFNLTPESACAAVTDRTKVLMPVHLYGQTADMTGLGALAEERGLRIVEDAAQAHGATFEGRGAGTFGLGSFSFYATKNLTTGEGGMITTNDADLADRLRVLRNQGMRQRYQYEVAGHNYRMTDLQAALVLPQLDSYGDNLTKRRANAARLTELLGDVDGLVLPQQLPGREHVWHQYTVLLPEERAEHRESIIERLRDEHGVGSGVYYPKTVYDYDCYRDREDVVIGDAPVADAVVRRCLSIPVHAYLSSEDVETIADSLRKVLA